ncbi:ribonuclease R [Pleionea sp. CnH1-48]|uniref:ribonuclease R n=1 Tax=Pleionea sp. CnH1-48 TaxID=2954494 RepID=UPI002097606C|nr:ribonuclease R [Pleionea sp. CnH1-48]MCO7226455.1 ribonuclease R [Pleionea sp. CnH1-48]
MPKNKIRDPFREREAKKYENPIPSREFILEFLESHDGPARFNEIFSGLGLDTENSDDHVALSRRLKAMERDGQIIRNRKDGYGPVSKLDLCTGRVEGHRDGFGFFVSDDGGDDWYLSPREMRKVFHGERVVVRCKGIDHKGRTEAKIVEVLEDEDNAVQMVGRYYFESGIGFVTPNDNRFTHDILIPEGQQAGAEPGQVVVARVVHRPQEKSQPVGAVVQVLGDYLAPGMEIDVAIHNYGIRREWPDAVMNELQSLAPEVTEADKAGRRDLRDLPFVTIDGEDARDFDDAVYCEWKDSGGWRLWVAIADVSHYVTPESALDKEAVQRGTSVYFPEYVVPMLPEQISNGLCSLNPHVDRLCMVSEITVSAKGKISGYKFYPAVMHSKARLTYTKVWDMLQGDEALREEYAELLPHIQELYALYQSRLKVRKQRGAIEFETTETQIVFNEGRKIDKVVPVERNDAHRIIEECMICANVAAARFFIKKKIPGMYRIHEGPTEKKLEDLRSYLGELGLFMFGGHKPTPKDYSELLKGVVGRPDFEQVQTMLLRSMSQAVYSPDNEGHFGLAFNAYTHFTSPIRRYPDLIIHRVIKSELLKDERATKQTKQVYRGALPYSHEQLTQLGESCSAMERNADMATRDVLDWLKCEFMTSRVGQEYEGEVVAVTNFGLFVRLQEFYIEGLIHITSLGRDYFHFDAGRQRLVGERSGSSFRLGDKLLVQVASVDLEDRKIDFELVRRLTERKEKSSGRSERDKLYGLGAAGKKGKKDPKKKSSVKGRKSSTKKSTGKKSKGAVKSKPKAAPKKTRKNRRK